MEKENELIKSDTDKVVTQDPRPEWMREFHNSVKGGSKSFKEWAVRTITVNIDRQLAYDVARGAGDKARNVVDAISNQKSFILYQDGKRWALIIPKLNSIVQFFPNNESEIKILEEKQFQNHVKYLYVLFPLFEYPSQIVVRNCLSAIINQMQPRLVSHGTMKT